MSSVSTQREAKYTGFSLLSQQACMSKTTNSWFCSFRRRRRRRSTGTRTWRELLEVTGPGLWTVRKEAFSANTRSTISGADNEDDSLAHITKLPLQAGFQNSKKHYVSVITSASVFQDIETKYHLDKIRAKNTSGPLPLTQCTGSEWVRQRKLVTLAFSDIPTLSLKAAEYIRFSFILNCDKDIFQRSVCVDLKDAILKQSLGWVVRLFVGKKDFQLEKRCFEYWSHVRARNKPSGAIQKNARELFATSMRWDCGGILLQLSESAPSQEEATVNAINAMIAALDAVQSITFWTIWNLLQNDSHWQRGRQEVIEACKEDKQIRETDLHLLAQFKKQATKGQRVNYAGLSFIGRALAETIRVYPPIFTLPRAASNHEVLSTKVDIPSINAALDRHWNPDRVGPDTAVASFGLGKRHCPAGTAAIYASYTMIHRFLRSCKSIKECVPGKALQCVYLGPTLCVDGSQLFDIVPSS